jgi:hypothetical protein
VWCSSTWEDAAHKLSSSKLYKTIIQTKENLAKKNCLDNDTCEVCNSATESAAHLIAGCSFSAGFWRRIGVELTEEAVADLWNGGRPPHIPRSFQCLGATMLLAIVEVQIDISPYVVRVIVMEYQVIFASSCENIHHPGPESYVWRSSLLHVDNHAAAFTE